MIKKFLHKENLKKGRYLLAGLLTLVLVVRIFGKVRGVEVSSVPTEFTKDYPLYFQTQVSLKSSSESYLSVTKGGRLDQIMVKTGDVVKKGQILGLVDQIKRASEARSALAKFQYAAREYSRFKKMYGAGVSTAQEVDDSSRSYEEAKANMEQAKNDLQESVIKAPYDGVATVAFQVGDVVPDGGRVVMVEDNSEKEAVIKIPPALKEQVKSEMEILLDGKKVLAKLEEAVPGSAFDTLGVEFKVRFKLPENFHPTGNMVALKLPLSKVPQVAKFSSDALLSKAGELGVLVVKEKKLTWRPLKPLDQNLLDEKARVIVSSELTMSEQVVLPSAKIMAQNKWASLIGQKAHVVAGKTL